MNELGLCYEAGWRRGIHRAAELYRQAAQSVEARPSVIPACQVGGPGVEQDCLRRRRALFGLADRACLWTSPAGPRDFE
ncbi:MAG: hypothetical protein ACLUYZ_02690 [Lachnospiraceae bacterium]